jgi:hypothetical protein
MELVFKEFDYKTDLVRQRELFNDCFPETKGDMIQSDNHYYWKFHSFPYSTNSFEYVCLTGSDIVAYYAAIPYQYKIGNKTTSVGMVCDVMTSSKLRGKGIFTKMGAYSTEQLCASVPFTMGYPIRKEVIPGHLKVGWEIPFELPLYMKFLKFNSLLTQRKLKFLVPFSNIFLFAYSKIVSEKNSNKYSYSTYDKIDQITGYDLFAQEWNKTVRNSLQKNLDFANWRYSAPGRKYSFLTIEKDSKIVCFVAYRKILKEGIPSYGLLDYMVLPGYEDCHGLVNKTLATQARLDKVEIIMTMMSRTSASKYRLLKNGFIKSPFKFSLIIKNLNKEFSREELFKEENWHLMWVDSDDL